MLTAKTCRDALPEIKQAIYGRLARLTLRHRFAVSFAATTVVTLGIFFVAVVSQASRLETARLLVQTEAVSLERLVEQVRNPALGDGSAEYRFDLERIAPLGPGEKNAAVWFADFNFTDGLRREEFRAANRRAHAKQTPGIRTTLAPHEPLLLEAEEWVNQRVMRFYPDIWVPSGFDTQIVNMLMAQELSWAWVARGDANENLEEALEDYRRAIRLGRLLRQEDFMLFHNMIGLRCIRVGLESMFRRLQAEGDQLRMDQVALALSQAINDRLTSTRLVHMMDVDSYVHAGLFSLSMDLPDWKLEQIATIALENPDRDLRRETAMPLCKIHWHGAPQQRRRARQVMDQLARNDGPDLATDAVCAMEPYATGSIAKPD